jgi:hypothetical protein
MSGHECVFCHVERAVTAVTPVIKGYAMKALECPKCRTVVRLIVMHPFPHGTGLDHSAEKQGAA